ncbi:hypothetical protein BX600DRAFT_450062 [Xylariales sp. PMI_506]|nr:hypothetical protein BX600DRAFT_450062 [Xylariales sp. PMI_506]
MYASWVRAFRSTARTAPTARATARQTRCLHASAPTQAAANSEDPSSGSRDDDGKPGQDDGDNASQEGLDNEKVSSEAGVNGTGEPPTRRQRRAAGSWRGRASRTQVTEDIPPLEVPANFHLNHVFRHDDVRESPLQTTTSAEEPSESEHKQRPNDVFGLLDAKSHEECFENILDATAWTDADVQETIGKLQIGEESSILLRGDIAVLAAACYIASLVPKPPKNKRSSISEVIEKFTVPGHHLIYSDQMRAAKFKEMELHYLRMLPYAQSVDDSVQALRKILQSKIPFRPELGSLHHDLVLEASASIRADFTMRPSKNATGAEAKRAMTILNFPYYSGFAWSRHIVQDIAAEVGADVLHLRAHDIGRIVGSFLGQDAAQDPGSLFLLGYRSAENSGRIRTQTPEPWDAAAGNTMTIPIMISAEKLKKDSKKKPSLMEQLISESNRGRGTELWDGLKVNLMLRELIQTADPITSEPQPLIVHVHDVNAIMMDEECGAVMLGKLRKLVDSLWSKGRQIVLVGSCSSFDAPRRYLTALSSLETAERVITLHSATVGLDAEKPSLQALAEQHNQDKKFIAALKTLQRHEFVDENAQNIGSMLETLLKPSYEKGLPRIDFDLHKMGKSLPKTLSDRILPVSEVYRIAKTIIGLPRRSPGVFDQSVCEDAIRLIKHIDEAKDRISISRDPFDLETRFGLSSGMMGASGGDHEDKFMSALVNPKDIKTTFADIHAPKTTIESIKMLTELSLIRPEAFSYGVLSKDRIPGCLLYGPPGTGKTLLAKAVAKESGANMIEISGASINNMYLGESEKNVQAIFKLAKKKEPLVIFLDEADALLGARGRHNEGGARRDIINQFLREWDGMDTTKAFIMVATNRPFDLDDAVLRRLPRKILVDLPLEIDRAAILRIHLKGEILDEDVSIEQIAKQTPLYSGSDLKNVCVAAAMAAVKEELELVRKNGTAAAPYVLREKRVLDRSHFDRALAEIPASVSEDMATLNAIKKFDERYGERTARRKKRTMGFEVVPEPTDSHEARVRGSGR